MRKFISLFLSMCLLINCFSMSVFATDNDNVVTFESVKESAVRQNKVIDMASYENELKNALSESERQKILKKYEKYKVNEIIIYPDDNLSNSKNADMISSLFSNSITSAEGSTRIVQSYMYGSSVNYDSKNGSDLNAFLYTAVNIGIGWSHPALGAFMSILGLMIQEGDYSSYKSVIITTLHDYVVISKQFQVYNGSNWITMVTSQKKETNAQVNTVYYKNTERKTGNKDLNIVKEDIGNYYYNESTLLTQAINLYYSGSSPFVYYYYNGQVINYNNDSMYFTY